MKKSVVVRWLIFAVAVIVFIISLVQICRILVSDYQADRHYTDYDAAFVTHNESDRGRDSSQQENSAGQSDDSGQEASQSPSADQETSKGNKPNLTQEDLFESGEETEEPVLPITVDFEKVQEQYPDVVGWIYMEGTPINYPVVQGEDNSFYVDHLPDGKYNRAGSIFADYRNEPVGEDLNYILYGHNMKNGSMFGTIVKFYDQEYYDEHPYYYYLTPEKNYRVDLLAGVVMDAYSKVLNEGFETEEGLSAYMWEAMQQTTFKSNVSYEEGDRLISMSTCSYQFDTARYVLMGILTELE